MVETTEASVRVDQRVVQGLRFFLETMAVQFDEFREFGGAPFGKETATVHVFFHGAILDGQRLFVERQPCAHAFYAQHVQVELDVVRDQKFGPCKVH